MKTTTAKRVTCEVKSEPTSFKKHAFLSLLVFNCTLLTSHLTLAFDLGFAKEDGGQPGAFLDYAASARSMGMGRAHTAQADDASAIYSNPGALHRLDQKDVVAHYSALAENTSYGSVYFAQPTVDIGVFGVGLVDLRSTNFDRRNDVGDKTGTFTTAENALFISYGNKINNRWGFGVTGKAVRQEIDIYSATGFGADAGLHYVAGPRWRWGLMAQNLVAPSIKLKSQTDRYIRRVRLGAEYQLLKKLYLSVDGAAAERQSIKPFIGAEWRQNNALSLRAGINENEVTGGLGVQLKSIGLDYAFSFHDASVGVEDLGGTHRLGFHWAFGRKASEEKASARWQRRGQQYLLILAQKIDSGLLKPDFDTERAIAGASQTLKKQGYVQVRDVYAAQGYLAYFAKEYDRSVASLTEAVRTDPADEKLLRRLNAAKALLTETQAQKLVAAELKKMKDFFAQSDYKHAIESATKVLTYDANNVEAQAYVEDARKRLQEPIDRQMRIGKAHFQQGDYLDAIKNFQQVKELDPANKEAARLMAASIKVLEKQASAAGKPASAVPAAVAPTVDKDSVKSRELYGKGLVLYSRGQLKEASDFWRDALIADPDNTLARTAFNRVQLELGNRP